MITVHSVKSKERRHRLGDLRKAGTLAAAAVMALGLAACGNSAGSGSSGGKVNVTLAYSSNFVLDTAGLTTKYYNLIAKEFDQDYPKAHLQLEPIPGVYSDIITKLSLMYHSASTTPDVAEMPTEQIGVFSSAGDLLALNKYIGSSAWWKGFPKVVQGEGMSGGKIYAVDQGENDEFLYYNKADLAKAGISLPWHPRTWQDILTAAEQIKARVPNVSPLWLNAGTSQGASGILQGAGNLIYGTSTPYIQDPANGKWVISSPGIDATIQFVRTIESKGLNAPTSDLFNTGAIQPFLFAKNKLAIAIGSNWYGGAWTKQVCAPCWPSASSTLGVAPVPTEFGQAPGAATTIGGWDLAVAASTPHVQYSIDLLNLMENAQNEVLVANYAGFVAPNTTYGSSSTFTNFAPPFNAQSTAVLPDGREIPSSSNFNVWAEGFNDATAQLAQNPSTSVQQALNIFQSYVKNQLGAAATETLP